MTAKELREKRNALIKQAREIHDKALAEKREQTAEERSAWDKIMGGVDPEGKRIVGDEERLKEQIDKLDRLEGLETEMRAPAGGLIVPGREDRIIIEPTEEVVAREQQRNLALRAWMMAQRGMELRPEHEEACRAVGMKPRVSELVINLRGGDYRHTKSAVRRYAVEGRAGAANPQSVAIGISGGLTVPEGFVNNLEIALLKFGGIRKVADVMRTTGGGDLPWPTVNDTSVKGRRIAENSVVNKSDLTFGNVVFHAYKYTSDLVLCPVELIEDSAFNLADFIAEACGTRIGRIQSDEFTTYSGAGGPTGLVTAATLGQTAASSSAIAGDDIYGLKHSVDPAYREMEPTWMMHDLILLAIKKLKDGLGRYLWQSSLAGGAPDTLDGDPIVINQSMSSVMSSGNKTMTYGAHQKYKIRDVSEMRFRRLVERYADNDQEGFVLFMRSDANLLDAGTHPVKYLQH